MLFNDGPSWTDHAEIKKLAQAGAVDGAVADC
jgi:hypothetical protein